MKNPDHEERAMLKKCMIVAFSVFYVLLIGWAVIFSKQNKLPIGEGLATGVGFGTVFFGPFVYAIAVVFSRLILGKRS